MATSSALNFIIDITNPTKSGIIQSFQNRLPAATPLLIRNDTETVSLRFVQPSAGTARPWDDVDYTTAQTILGLGEFDVVPTSGTFTVQFGPRTTGTTNSTTTVTITGSTTGIVNGMLVAGAGIVPGTTATISGSTVTLSNAATASATGVSLYFYDETAGIATGASAATVSTAVNALASVVAVSGVTVTSPEAGTYLYVLPAGVTPGYFSGSPAGLNPASSIVVSEVVVGASGIASEQLAEIFVNAYALNSTWTAFPAASATVTSVATGASVSTTGNNTSGQNTITSLGSTSGIVVGMSVSGTGIPANTVVLAIVSSTVTLSNVTTSGTTGGTYTFTTPSVQSVAVTAGAYDGSISLTTPLLTTQAIPVPLTGATAGSIQTALNALGANYTVSGNPGGPWAISDPTGSNTAISVNVSNLIVPIGLTGTLNLSTYAMLQKFISSGLSELSLDLECQVTPVGGGQTTPLQLLVSVNKNVINLAALVPSPTIAFYTKAQVDSAIATAQALDLKVANNLSDLANTATARTNLGLGTAATHNATDFELEAWIIKTTTYTAVAGNRIQADTSGAAWTLTLPASAAAGDSIQVEDAELSWNTNNLTIARNGLKINGGTSNYTASVVGNKLSIVYISSGYGWSIK